MQKETKGAGAPRHFTFKEKLAALGPGFLICGSFIGPGTVTSSTRAGAGYGYELLWCIVFSVIAVIVTQGMAARLGVVTQKDLAETLQIAFDDRPLLRKFLVGLVAVAIAVGGFAYMGGDLTGTALGVSALTGVSTHIIAPIWYGAFKLCWRCFEISGKAFGCLRCSYVHCFSDYHDCCTT